MENTNKKEYYKMYYQKNKAKILLNRKINYKKKKGKSEKIFTTGEVIENIFLEMDINNYIQTLKTK